MSDPNRERWLTEATAWLDSYFGPTGTLNHAEIESARDAYLAACEKYAPRWVIYGTERYWALWDAGWREIIEASDHRLCMVSPTPPPPGGEK